MPVSWGKGALKPSVGSSGGRSTPQQNLETLQPTAQKPARLPCGGKPQQKGLNCAGFSPTLTVVHRAPWDQLSRVGCPLMALSLVTPHTPVCRVNFSTSLCCYLLVGFQGWKEGSE